MSRYSVGKRDSNESEICDAVSFLLDRQDDLDAVTLDDLMQFVKEKSQLFIDIVYLPVV